MSEYTQGICMDGAAILKDGEMLTIEEILEGLRAGEEAKQQATAYRISLENLEASLPKVRAAAIRLLINEEMVVGRLRNDSMRSFIFVSDAKAFADKLEQGNETL